ncbi:NADH-quinone oxidoreductase subunit C [Saccharopolyspora montiporae]|uniref:NADH-quinone oxidoreductase subunit C n=1 Tax=Saccharopolyspora montiporae TaxID=2781240 RepID=UPI00351C5556
MTQNGSTRDTQSATTPGPGEPGSSAERPGELQPVGGTGAPSAGRARRGMFGVQDGGDTSGYGGLHLPGYVPPAAQRPYGGWFDEVADALFEGLGADGVPDEAVQQVTVDRGELTFHIRPAELPQVCRRMRDDPALRFELCSSMSGVDYGEEVPQRLHAVYHLTSMTYRRRVRLDVAADWPGADGEPPRIPSVVSIYPTADFQERETWDMFGIVFDGHPALTRILMPDDWDGHPQRKDYPLGGIPVEYKGAEIPPPDQRRAYT